MSQVCITFSTIVRPKAIIGCFLFPQYIQSINLIYFLARIFVEAKKGKNEMTIYLYVNNGNWNEWSAI